MTDLAPEILMAYVDDTLEPEQRREVEAALATDPDAREIVAQLRRSSELLGESLDDILDQPVPQRLVDAARGRSSKVVTLRPRTAPLRNMNWPGLAAAASILLVVGIAAGRLWVSEPPHGTTMAAMLPLQQALEHQESGVAWTDPDSGMTITPILTFRAADGRPCREFERQQRDGEVFGVACRDNQGRWVAQIELQRSLLPDNVPNDQYLPASGGTDPISDVLDELDAGPALSISEEMQFLESGWQ
jgi:hypothetical protein